jgi:hypothetical protein
MAGTEAEWEGLVIAVADAHGQADAGHKSGGQVESPEESLAVACYRQLSLVDGEAGALDGGFDRVQYVNVFARLPRLRRLGCRNRGQLFPSDDLTASVQNQVAHVFFFREAKRFLVRLLIVDVE